MASRAREEARKKGYKQTIDPDEARRKREEYAVEVRKSKREERIVKRRVSGSAASFPALDGAQLMVDDWTPDARGGAQLSKLDSYVRSMFTNNQQQRFENAVRIGLLLDTDADPPIDQIVRAGVVPLMAQFLDNTSSPKLQYQAALVLGNICCGTLTHVQAVAESGAIPKLVNLVSSEHEPIREQAISALANISAEGPSFRDLVLDHKAMEGLLLAMYNHPSRTTLRISSWALSNFCRGSPPPRSFLVRKAVPTIAALLVNDDEDVVAEACYALSRLSDIGSDLVEEILENNVARKLVDYMLSENQIVQRWSIRTVGSIAGGNDDHAQVVIDNGALPNILELLNIPRKSVRKDACWVLSNITAGCTEQIQAVLDEGIIPALVYMMGISDFDVKKEITWVLSNAACEGTRSQVGYLVDCGVIPALCDMLEAPDAVVVEVTIDAVTEILKVGQRMMMNDVNSYALLLEGSGGLEKLVRLEQHERDTISDKASSIVETFFSSEIE
mmetsp:Transcript_2400/g.10185  ORF Transcript_2400/g.10185 Transcript_2400/m.10185 type:complete len:502 (+) Transcript_2400:5264-6769(+)|eukprot:CAMPEP_0113966678 /NCGR_PEP_ID=MMETSP0011_2-20120614/8455_1 /TAXON_ID=101924 /ORGANISM="Rhodosorus marinus" /LENGTH=501 /DNA_ID=CAMNT_0000979371 /DNA_START=261 /DNA_END=1766 /DNA_ORIENTATION=- /assembly_acc=CAM_ASM_000156